MVTTGSPAGGRAGLLERSQSLDDLRPIVVAGASIIGGIIGPTRFSDPHVAQRAARLLRWAGCRVTVGRVTARGWDAFDAERTR